MAVNLVKIVAITAKIQAVYDTDPVPALATDAIRFSGVPILALKTLEDGSRDDVQFGGMGRLQRAAPQGRTGAIPVTIELFGKGSAYATSNTATDPFQHDVFLRGSGFNKSFSAGAVTYSDVDVPTEYFTLYLYGIDGNLYKLINCVAKPKLSLVRGQPGVMTYDVEGRLLAAPAGSPGLTGLALPVQVPAPWGDALTTIGAWSSATAAPNQLLATKLDIDLGTVTKMRDWSGANTLLGPVIVDRAPNAAMEVEAVALTTFDPYTAAMNVPTAQDTRINTQLGAAAGNTIAISTAEWAIEQPTQLNLGGLAGWGLKGDIAAKTIYNSANSRLVDIKVS